LRCAAGVFLIPFQSPTISLFRDAIKLTYTGIALTVSGMIIR